ncbi:2-oxoacid:acceptor oxidoreductase family protein [Synergistaceae bacterium OttesenSCG-928-D05]|nr:2-oxoacid:acceptor oxidoreductase family protein [Synergistaceae bacterium OttesenSCG-928-D05]
MRHFTRTVFCAGFGGQGVMVLGQMIAYAGMGEGRYVTWLPSYGPEMRGGTANCGVVVSEAEVGSPFVTKADVVITFNQPSLDKYESIVKPGGILIYNSDIAEYTPTREDIKVLPVPASRLANEAQNDKALNVVMLGVLVNVSDVIKEETAERIIREKLGAKKPELIENNLAAYEKGKRINPEWKTQ